MGAEAVRAEVRGEEALGSEALGAEATGAEAVAAEAVRAEAVGAEAVGVIDGGTEALGAKAVGAEVVGGWPPWGPRPWRPSRGGRGHSSKSGERFKERMTVYAATIAHDRSGNERAVNVCKRSGVMKRGFKPNMNPIRFNYAWRGWAF